jgi:hypothetical protein
MGQLMVFAEPSNWATEFIDEASNDNLIPETLKADYQNNIKRYEYVLLALRVLDQNNINVEIKETDPFTDIANHTYKDEIIRAYNAGIVGGYEDNTFRPDNEIKREEVAALVYNLVKAINKDTELPSTRSTFSDTDKISNWALPYIEFNYVKSIISGIGKIDNLDTIDPLGKTTREQSITLLYKVSVNQELLAKVDFDSIVVKDQIVNSDKLNKAAQNIGYDMTNELINISKKEYVNEVDIIPQSYAIIYDAEETITVSKTDGVNYLIMTLTDLNDTQVINDFESVLKAYDSDNLLLTNLDPIISKFKENKRYLYYMKTNNGGTVECSYTDIDGVGVYKFGLWE